MHAGEVRQTGCPACRQGCLQPAHVAHPPPSLPRSLSPSVCVVRRRSKMLPSSPSPSASPSSPPVPSLVSSPSPSPSSPPSPSPPSPPSPKGPWDAERAAIKRRARFAVINGTASGTNPPCPCAALPLCAASPRPFVLPCALTDCDWSENLLVIGWRRSRQSDFWVGEWARSFCPSPCSDVLR